MGMSSISRKKAVFFFKNTGMTRWPLLRNVTSLFIESNLSESLEMSSLLDIYIKQIIPFTHQGLLDLTLYYVLAYQLGVLYYVVLYASEGEY